MRITKDNTLWFTDDQASAIWGDDWAESIRMTDGHLFLDGIEYNAEVETTRLFHTLELTPVYEELNLEDLYS